MSRTPSYLYALPHLRTWREYACLTQDELARLANISKGTISALENERLRTTIVTVRALAQVFGIHPHMLIKEQPSSKKEITEHPTLMLALQSLEDHLFARIMQRVRAELEAMEL